VAPADTGAPEPGVTHRDRARAGVHSLPSTRRRPAQESAPGRSGALGLVDARRIDASAQRLAVLVTASASTTLLLALGFAITAELAPVSPSVSFASLLVGYLIGGAVGSAVPVPAGVGATEAALVAVLVAGRMPLASAISSVLLFRVVTFWAPAVAGLVLARRLRRLAVL
jgi:uncharacterized membrane protein YbhN (UPF0104 family)